MSRFPRDARLFFLAKSQSLGKIHMSIFTCPVRPSGYFKYHHVSHSQILHTAHTAYMFPFVGLSDQTAIVLLYNIN